MEGRLGVALKKQIDNGPTEEDFVIILLNKQYNQLKVFYLEQMNIQFEI